MKRYVLFLLLAFIGWAVCGAMVMGGRLVMSMGATLVFHAVGAPLVFGVLAYIYHRIFPGTSSMGLAAGFLGFIIFMDIFVVALLIEKSFAMFLSPMGTWIPWALIVLSVRAVGERMKLRPSP